MPDSRFLTSTSSLVAGPTVSVHPPVRNVVNASAADLGRGHHNCPRYSRPREACETPIQTGVLSQVCSRRDHGAGHEELDSRMARLEMPTHRWN